MRNSLLSLVLILPIVGAMTIAACSSSNSTSSGGGACTASADCSGGQVCGFDTGQGCTATGVCVTPTSANPFPACGCDGQPVSYVALGYTSAPVKSDSACTEDAGAPVEDAATDAQADAPLEAAAASEAGSDSGLDGSIDGETSDGGTPDGSADSSVDAADAH